MRRPTLAVCICSFISGCLAGPPKNGPECNEADDKPCPSGEVCMDFVCRLVCRVSRDCPGADEACINSICRPFSDVCDIHENCPEGWFCNGSGACQKYPHEVSCNNGVTDGDETDIDCGGDLCSPCGLDKTCRRESDCQSLSCNAEDRCMMATCDDNQRNGRESDVDCGGPNACDRCTPGDDCTLDDDCDSGVCVSFVCAPSSCSDDVQNGGETDLNCGGTTSCARCATGDNCLQAGDCASNVCQDHICRPANCQDETQNGAETDVDCGGFCKGCKEGQGCGSDDDCHSRVCDSNNACAMPVVVDIVTGSCAVLSSGEATCWGPANRAETIGDDESPAAAGVLDVHPIQNISTGATTCAHLVDNTVTCWGATSLLGYGDIDAGPYVGDDESPTAFGVVNLGGEVKQIAAGYSHSCAVLWGGNVRCWGYGEFGQLGYGNTEDILNQVPASVGLVHVGGEVKQISVGVEHTCALLANGQVRCWGNGRFGVLGYGNNNNIGDDEDPADAGSVDVGGTVESISCGGYHTCVLLTDKNVRCWGPQGYVGYGESGDIGDTETPASAGNVDIGGSVSQLSAGCLHSCAVLANKEVRCWGASWWGELGYPGVQSVGYLETPAEAGSVEVGGPVSRISAGCFATCALLDTGEVRCWGDNRNGQLGYGHTNNIGDDETPASAGNVIVVESEL